MYPPLNVCVYPTSIRFKMKDPITLETGMDLSLFNKSLTEFSFNYEFRKWFASRRYGIYEPSTHVASIPRYYLKDFVNYVKYFGGSVNILQATTNPGRDVKFQLNSFWKPRDYQIPAIAFLTQHNPQLHMRALPLDVGQGKTAVSLFSIAYTGKVALVIVEGLIEQWYNVICKGNNGKPPMFDINEEDVYVIQGQQSLVDLIEAKDYKPSIILGSLGTMRNYIARDKFPYCEMPTFDDLAQRLGIGFKVNDEAHKAFGTIVDIDLRTNININVYLSATLTRGDRQSKKIFKTVFPSIIMYDPGERKKHVKVFYHPYNLGYINENRVVSQRYGYNQNKYESIILKNPDMQAAFLERVNSYFFSYFLSVRTLDEKCMVMASSRGMCDLLMDHFTNTYPELRVKPYYDKAGDENLHDVDVIISTVKKGGTGTDIDNLRTLINTISIGSEVQPVQILGRLRPLAGGVNPIYVAMYNTGIPAHIRHYKFCRKIYRERALEYVDFSTTDYI